MRWTVVMAMLWVNWWEILAEDRTLFAAYAASWVLCIAAYCVVTTAAKSSTLAEFGGFSETLFLILAFTAIAHTPGLNLAVALYFINAHVRSSNGSQSSS